MDRVGLRIALPPNVVFFEAEVEALPELPKGEVDVVVSDLAPHTTGDRFVDEQASLGLFRAALAIAAERLRRGGSFVGKLFQGGDFSEARKEVGAIFEQVRVMKPRASRSESVEIYLAGLRRR